MKTLLLVWSRAQLLHVSDFFSCALVVNSDTRDKCEHQFYRQGKHKITAFMAAKKSCRKPLCFCLLIAASSILIWIWICGQVWLKLGNFGLKFLTFVYFISI